MHPYNYHFHSGPFCRGPSRILFFAFGAIAATWYHHAKYGKDSERYMSGVHRHQIPPPPPPPSPSQENIQPYPPPSWSRVWEQRPTQEQLSRQAADAMEATLDSVLRTVESLKGKLAEQRSKAEEQRAAEAPREPSDPITSS